MSDVDRSDKGKQGILVLSKDEARERAKDFDGREDPFPHIPHALMSADHIIEYAKMTGMISPLFVGGNRMKKASYQGRIGEYAYRFNNSKGPFKIPMHNELTIKANSIVFVECDLDFRLPDFIAVRFNLHIRHVHRGLLLGTGPLVDPGYWGKLCIPLHNLTDKNYSIPRNEGLIWVEFTKTSSEALIGRKPSGTGFWDIRDFIERAAKQYGKSRVPIRSSIPVSVEKAEKAANDAANRVKSLAGIGYLAIFTAIIGFAAIVYTAHDNIQSAYHFVESAEGSKSKLNEKNIESLQLKIKDMEKDIQELHKQILRNQPTDTERQDSPKE